MTAISFSAIEILPSLLDKTKTQTIRSLFCDVCSKRKLAVTEMIAKDWYDLSTPKKFVVYRWRWL